MIYLLMEKFQVYIAISWWAIILHRSRTTLICTKFWPLPVASQPSREPTYFSSPFAVSYWFPSSFIFQLYKTYTHIYALALWCPWSMCGSKKFNFVIRSHDQIKNLNPMPLIDWYIYWTFNSHLIKFTCMH